MREIAERFNYCFWGDFIGGGFCGRPLVEVQVDRVGLDELRCGRTLECIRAEYLEHKAEYDAGIVPGMKEAGIKEGVKKEFQMSRIRPNQKVLLTSKRALTCLKLLRLPSL